MLFITAEFPDTLSNSSIRFIVCFNRILCRRIFSTGALCHGHFSFGTFGRDFLSRDIILWYPHYDTLQIPK